MLVETPLGYATEIVSNEDDEEGNFTEVRVILTTGWLVTNNYCTLGGDSPWPPGQRWYPLTAAMAGAMTETLSAVVAAWPRRPAADPLLTELGLDDVDGFDDALNGDDNHDNESETDVFAHTGVTSTNLIRCEDGERPLEGAVYDLLVDTATTLMQRYPDGTTADRECTLTSLDPNGQDWRAECQPHGGVLYTPLPFGCGSSQIRLLPTDRQAEILRLLRAREATDVDNSLSDALSLQLHQEPGITPQRLYCLSDDQRTDVTGNADSPAAAIISAICELLLAHECPGFAPLTPALPPASSA